MCLNPFEFASRGLISLVSPWYTVLPRTTACLWDQGSRSYLTWLYTPLEYHPLPSENRWKMAERFFCTMGWFWCTAFVLYGTDQSQISFMHLDAILSFFFLLCMGNYLTQSCWIFLCVWWLKRCEYVSITSLLNVAPFCTQC